MTLPPKGVVIRTKSGSTLKFHRSMPDDHPMYGIIGLVASEWSRLEHTLDQTIWAIAGFPPTIGACVTGQMMGIAPRFNALVALSECRLHSQFNDKLTSLMNKSFQWSNKRNRIVHDTWFVDNTTESPGQFRTWPKGDLTFGISDADKEEVDTTIAATRDLIARVTAIKSEMMDCLRSWQETPLPPPDPNPDLLDK